MQYRNFGILDWKPSALGFGCMRLPTIDNQPGGYDINEREAIKMIRSAIDSEVNYIDTAYVYHQGNSELVVGKALQDGYRERVKIATKSPVWLINKPSDFDRLLDEQRKKISTSSIDFYLLHALNQKSWKNIVLKHNILSRAQSAIKDGRIHFLGFSFHDNYECFEEIVNAFDWDFCQIQYNYMDIHNQAGTKGLKLAARKGIGVVVMEPLMGGLLANPPEVVKNVLDKLPIRFSPAELALKWIWSHPEVSLVLSGMSTVNQVEENLNSARKYGINSLDYLEKAAISSIRKKYRSRIAVPCTNCKYCMPCPHGVDIPGNFEYFNHAFLYDDIQGARFRYSFSLSESQRSDRCAACKECEENCPQKIAISTWMPKVNAMMDVKV
jgi:uncharacterized protein